MATATTKVPCSTSPWGDDKIVRPLDNTALTYYPGAMIALNASGSAVKMLDSTALKFDGINAETERVVVLSGEAVGDRGITVERPWRFQMAIAAAVLGDEGRVLYAVDDQTVGYTSVNSIQVGWVDQVISATLVSVRPMWAGVNGTSNFDNNTLSFTGANTINNVAIPDNLADALHFSQGANVYAKFVTTDGSESSQLRGPDATGVTGAGGAALLTGGIGGATSGTGGAATIAGGAGTAGNSAGGAVSATGGAGQGSAAGGAATIAGGLAGATGAGGAVAATGGAGGATSGAGGAASLTGGAGTAGNSAGGAASLIGGAGAGSSAGGAITITSGAAGATGVAGAVNISVGGATAGNGSALTLTAGNGAGGTASGGNVNLVPGTAVSTGTPGEIQVNSAAGLFEVNWQQFLAASVPVSGTSYGVFLANRACRVKAVRVTCSSTATVPTVDVFKDTGTTAPGGGTSVLTGTISFNTTANTTVSGTVSSTIATVTLAAGDRLTLKWGGTVGSITGAMVNILLVPV